MSTTPPEAPITFDSPPIGYDLIISDLIDSDLDLHIKLDALQVSHSSVTVNEISDPDRACRLNGITSIWNTVWEIQQMGISKSRIGKHPM